MWTLRRPAARVVLLDGESRIFMLRASDPMDPYKPSWWEIPGGGADRNEALAIAARRELYEETGFADVTLGPCIWTQYVEFEFAGMRFESDESIFIGWTDAPAQWQPKRLEALEAAAFESAKWWEIGELMASPEPVLPARLREFLPDVAKGVLPENPLDISPPLS